MKKIASLAIIILLSLIVVTPATACYEPRITKIKIGNISMSAATDLPGQQVLATIACKDINDYFASHRLPYRIEVEFKVAGDKVSHLDRVKEFQSEGIRLLLAGRWSSAAQYSLSYINANNILMLSPSCTATNLAIQGDNLFRLCPDDSYLGTALAHAVKTRVDKVVIIQRGDDWGNGVNAAFTSEYKALGGSVLGNFVYDPNLPTPDYSSCINGALTAINGYVNAGVVLFAYNEAVQILNLANSNYPLILGHTWFGGDGTANSQYIVSNAGDLAALVGLYSVLPGGKGPNWASVKSRYESATNNIFSTYTAYEYDIYWLYALSVAKVWSTNPSAVKWVLPSVAAKYNGASGYSILNKYGDRINPGFEIWGYSKVDITVQSIKVGSINTSNVVTWP
jgi:branched-chain amino acid transport system substrate-binding protein